MADSRSSGPDPAFMRRAIALSASHWGLTHPNPSVGCVVVRNKHILAEAATAAGGRPHAEALVLKKKNPAFRGADLYVTLEPCTHFGKTPPCADLVVSAGIRRVFVGVTDPNPLVNGKGIRLLRRAGLTVIRDVLKKECAAPNEWFFKRFHSDLPYVTVKTAVSLDGKIASSTGESRWISSPASRTYAHLLRIRHDAILTGTTTILRDDPSLTVRHGKYPNRQPHKVILDRTGRLPSRLRVFQSCGGESVFYFTASPAAWKKYHNHPFIRPFRVAERKGRLDLHQILLLLREHEIYSILVEGGGELNATLFENSWADKLAAVIAPKLIGGRTAPTLFDGKGFPRLREALLLKDVSYTASGPDMIAEGFLRRYA